MEVQFSQEVKATGETVKETAKHLQETAALLAKFFFNQFKGYLSNKQATALIIKGQTPDYVNVKVQGKDGFQPAVLILNPKLVKELQAGNTAALTEDSLKQNAILKYPFSKDKEPYLDNISKFLSPQQLEVLKEKKMIPEPVKIDFGNGKGENQYFVGINPNTNEINLTNTKYLNIPNEYKGAVLDKSLILAGKSQETKILNGEQTNDASIFFCPRTGKLKALTDNDIKSVALDASMNVPVSKYFMIESGNKTMFVNVDEFAKHHANGALKDKSITEFLSLKDKFGDNQVKVSTSNLRQWELAAPSDKLVLNITDKGKNFLIPFAEFNAQQNYLTAKNEGKTVSNAQSNKIETKPIAEKKVDIAKMANSFKKNIPEKKIQKKGIKV